MKRIIYCLIACLFCVMACHKVNDEPIAQEIHKCTLNLELSVDTYDLNTRSSGDNLVWKNGTKLFLNFSNSGNPIIGVAEYDATDDSWALSYTGDLNLADKEQVSVYFFTAYNANESQDVIALTPESAIYSDTDGTYSFLDDGELRVMAHLTPAVGRIRFKGEVGSDFSVQGVSTISTINLITQKNVDNNDELLNLSVGNDGYTSYVYGKLNKADRKIVLYHDYCRYEKLCQSNVLGIGKSGVMDVPNQTAHSGWELIPLPPTVETLQPADVYDMANLNGRLLSNGGNEIVEYGFLYGTSESHLRKYKIEDGPTDEFSYTILVTGDSTYYYQAYAINSIGEGIGELISFTPPSDVPTVITTEVSKIYHITGSRYRCNFYGKITSLNNSSLLDYGFEIDREVGWYSQITYIPLTENTEYHGFYGNTNTNKIDVDVPLEFAYTLYFESSTDYPVLRIRAYARNRVGISFGEEIEQDTVW